MAARIAFVLIAAFVVFQMLTWGTDATVIRRDVSTAKPADAGQTIDEALQSFKAGVEDLLKNIQAIDEALQSFKSSLEDLLKKIQSNELYQNVTQSLSTFSENLQTQGKQLVEKIQTAAKTESN